MTELQVGASGPGALFLAVLVGAALGAFFFGGLWWTVRRLPDSEHPVLLMLASLLVRIAVVLGGFWLVMDGRWERAVACLVGFTVVRFTGVGPAAPRQRQEAHGSHD